MRALPITLEEAESLAGLPAREWVSKCHQISSALAPAVDGKVRRGYYLGEINPDSYFGRVGGLAQHSWIELYDGPVLDPTRFAFKGGEPELWVGPDDEYDIGGCKQQARRGPEDPPGSWEDEDGERIFLDKLDMGRDYVAELLRVNPDEMEMMGLCQQQILYLAHLPILDKERPGILNRFYAAEVYEAIIDAGYSALIPIDRKEWILGS